MKKRSIHIIISFSTALLFMCASLKAQIDGNLLLGLNNVSTTDMNAISNPIQGSLLYNTSEKSVFQYNGSTWEAVGKAPNSWSKTGNTGTSSSTNFIGTTDAQDFVLRSNNIEKLRLVQDRRQILINQASSYNNHPLVIKANGVDIMAFQNNSGTTKWHWNILGNGLNFVETGVSDYRLFLKYGGGVGINTNNPTEQLDVNGRLRLRDIPIGTDSDKLLSTDTNGNIKKIDQPLKNKSYVQVYKTNRSFGSGNAIVLNLFPQVTIQAGKKVKIDLYVPTRDTTNSWGGLYVNINVKVNGTWYNLGNTGYDGGVMNNSATSIHALNHEMLLDFITNLSLPVDQSYTLQFELTARSYNGTTYVNQSHDINKTGNNLGSRGALQTWASNQNYCHIIIVETDI
ncbi:MAG: hypothetical protein QM485_01695 [Flavobacteriaceae bacterium]